MHEGIDCERNLAFHWSYFVYMWSISQFFFKTFEVYEDYLSKHSHQVRACTSLSVRACACVYGCVIVCVCVCQCIRVGMWAMKCFSTYETQTQVTAYFVSNFTLLESVTLVVEIFWLEQLLSFAKQSAIQLNWDMNTSAWHYQLSFRNNRYCVVEVLQQLLSGFSLAKT